MHVIVITPYFPTDSYVASNKWERLGREFVLCGHRVTVVTIDHPRSGLLSIRKLGNSPPEEIEVIRISLPVEVGLRYYLSLMIILSVHTVPKKLFRMPPKALRFSRNLQADRTLPWTYPDFRQAWVKAAFKQLTTWSVIHQVDIIIGSHHFAPMLFLADRLSRHLGIPWIADFRDARSQDHQGSGWIRSRLLRKTERHLLQSLSAVVTINRPLAGMLQTDRDVALVPNCYRGEEAGLKPPSPQSGPLRILYAGNVPAFSTVSLFFEALRKAEPMETALRIDYFGSQFASIRHHKDPLAGKGIQLVDHGFVSQETVLREARNSDLLLLFGWNGPGKECVVTGKVFDYLQAGRPIIAITERETALADLIEETGAGIVLDSREAIVRFFRELSGKGRAAVEALQANRHQDKVATYSAERCAAKYEAVLVGCVAGSQTQWRSFH